MYLGLMINCQAKPNRFFMVFGFARIFVPWGQTPPRHQAQRTWCENWGQCRWRIWRRRCCRRPAGTRPRWSCFWTRRCRAPWWPCKRSNIKWSSPRSPWTRSNVTKCAAGSLVPLVCTAASRRRLRTSSEKWKLY